MSETQTQIQTTFSPSTGESPEEFLDGVASTGPAISPDTDGSDNVVEQPEAQPETPPKPKPADRRFANLTAKLHAEAERATRAERERDAALALANVGKETPASPARTTPVDVEAEAARLIQQREFTARRNAVVADGQKQFTDWSDKTEVLHGLGATDNAHFMEALVELPNAAKVVAHLADDTDALVALLGKSPAAMAAAMGRLDAEVSKPVSKPLSNAPAPAPKIKPSGVVPEADPHNYPANMSMKEWSKMMDAHLPLHLGGKKRPA